MPDTPDPRPGRFPSGPRLLIAAAVLVCGVIAVVGGPYLIRAGYRGESLTVVNELFQGRDVHPLSFYMDAWWALVLTVSAILVGFLTVAYLAIRYPGARARALRSLLGDDVVLATPTLLWYGVLVGMTGGLLEALYRTVRQLATQRPEAGFFWELVWMIPISAALGALVVAVVLSFVAKAGGTRVGVAPATFVLGGLAVYGVLQSEGIPMHPAAEVVLSLGLAAAITRMVRPRASALSANVRRTRPFLLGASLLLMAFAVVRSPTLAERRASARLPEADPGRPNVLLIIWDTVRASNLSLYGYERETTPNLERWAESGAVYEWALATAPWTLPSHVSILTGRLPFETETGTYDPLAKDVPTLAEVLSAHGYATGGFVANLGYTSPMSGLSRGFGRYQAQRITFSQFVRSSWLSSTLAQPVQRLTGWPGAGKNGRHVTDEFVGWLDERDERPFLAFLNYFDAHDPYDPPGPFRQKFGPGAQGSWSDVAAAWDRSYLDGSRPPDVSGWVERYDGAIAFLDDELGALRDALAERQLLDNTVVLVTSDHGEQWGEHGFIEHGNSLYMPVLHVPLVVVAPGMIEGNQRIVQPVTLRDIPATILRLLGIEDDSLLPGQPIHPLEPLRAQGSEPSPILSELAAPVLGPMRDAADPTAARVAIESLVEGSTHYILNNDGSEELYDVRRDPDELDDLSGRAEATPILSEFRSRLTRLGIGDAGRP